MTLIIRPTWLGCGLTIIMWLVRKTVLLILRAIRMAATPVCVWTVSSLLRTRRWANVLRVLNGLLSSRTCGSVISLWVTVISRVTLLESRRGQVWAKLARLISLTKLPMCRRPRLVASGLPIRFKLTPLVIASYGNKWRLRKMTLCLSLTLSMVPLLMSTRL